MTYQNIANPADTLIQEIASTRSFLERVGAFSKMFFHVVAASSSGQARLNTVEWLQGKTDAELAELNIKRDEIVQHVFRDVYHL